MQLSICTVSRIGEFSACRRLTPSLHAQCSSVDVTCSAVLVAGLSQSTAQSPTPLAVVRRRTGSAPGIEMRTSPQVSDGSTGAPSREGSRHGGSAGPRLGASPLGGSPRSDEDGL